MLRVSKHCKLSPGDNVCSKYRVVSKLGSGRFSIVYEMEDTSTSQHYAVKMYRRGESNKQYFDNEYSVLKALGERRLEEGSKYVVGFHDTFAYLDTRGMPTALHPCISYTLHGDTVRSLLDYVRGGMPLATVKRMTREILSGLQFLHTGGIVHTDIKSNNILLTKRIDNIRSNDEISVVIADVGSATFADNLFSRKIGTQEYLSPEALLCLNYGTPTDIWSVMCLIYEMTTGDYLFNIDEFDQELESDRSSGDSSGQSSDEDLSAYNVSRDEREVNRKHLILMESLLGPMPSHLTCKDSAKQYYNNRGRLLGNPRISQVTIRGLLERDFDDISEEDAVAVESFILSGLKYSADRRPDCRSLLKHPWLGEKN